MAKTPQSKKAKGSKLEREVAKMLVDSGLDQYATRMPLSGAIAGLKADIHTKLPLQIECKAQEVTKFQEWFRQAEEGKNIGDRKIPIVVWTKNRLDRKFCYLDFQDFINILYYAMKGGLGDDT